MVLRLIPYLFVLLATVACSRSQESLMLDRADQLMQERPDSAIAILRQIPRKRLSNEASQARFALLMSQAMDKNRIDSDNDSLIRIALRYYGPRGEQADYRARTFYYAGRIHQHGGHVNEAMACYIEAEHTAVETSDTYLKGMIATALGRLYRKQHYYASSSARFEEAVCHFKQINHLPYELQTAMAAAADLYRMGDTVRSYPYFTRSKQLAEELQDTTALLYLARASATRAMDRGAYDEALETLIEASDRYADGVIPSDYYLALGKIFQQRGEVDTAAHFLALRLKDYDEQRRREELYDQSPGHWSLENEDTAGEFFAILEDYKRAYKRKNRALKTLDSIYRAEKQSLIPGMRGRFHRHMLEEQNHALRVRVALQWLLALMMCVAFLFLILWLITRRQRLILLQRQAISEYRESISRLKDAYMDLQMKPDKSIDPELVERRVAFLRQFLDVAVIYGQKGEQFYRKVSTLFSMSEGESVQWIFEDILNMREPEVVSYLRARYPQLTDREVLIYCMICCNLSNSAISLLLDISVKTYYNLRNVLRGKLELTNNGLTFSDHFEWLCREKATEKHQSYGSKNEKVIKKI